MAEVRETLTRFVAGLGRVNAEHGALLVRKDDYEELMEVFGLKDSDKSDGEFHFRGLKVLVIDNPIRRFEWVDWSPG